MGYNYTNQFSYKICLLCSCLSCLIALDGGVSTILIYLKEVVKFASLIIVDAIPYGLVKG